MTDIFKVRGWLDYLGLNKASFIVQQPNQMMDISKDIASKINVVLINNKDLDNSELLDSYSIAKGNIAEEMIESYSIGMHLH